MLKKAVVGVGVLVVLCSHVGAAGATSERIMPGVTYLREARSIGGARVLFHVVVGPKPGGLYTLRPVLSGNLVTGLETLSSMQRRMLRRANVVGVNGDLFTSPYGYPNSLYIKRGVLAVTPSRGRSSLGISPDGKLEVGKIGFTGTFQIAGGRIRSLRDFNRPIAGTDGFTLFAPSWGSHTPYRSNTREAILADVGRTLANRDRSARIVKVVRGSGHAIPRGGAILQARGTKRALLRADLALGNALSFRLDLPNWWDGVADGIGGGPELVRAGLPVYNPDEWFSSYQLYERHPRSAVGQTADGRIILLTADGRSRASAGLTTNQLAKAMAHYGAVTAMAFDGGGSAEMAFNGHVLNTPSDGHERPLSDSFQLVYIGAYAPHPRYPVFSPNGDGYHDVQRLYAKFVRKSDARLSLLGPDGRERVVYKGPLDPGTTTRDMRRRTLPEGVWRWVVAGTDLQGRVSRMVRRFRVNNTLGFLTLSTRRMTVRRRVGGHLRIGFRLAQSADVVVQIRRRSGGLVRRLVSRRGVAPGAYAVIWNGRNDDGSFVRSGGYFATVLAHNGLGDVSLRKGFRVRRLA